MEAVKKQDICIHHDGSVNIATGISRKETRWKNREMLWSELVEKFSTTTRTAENYAEYIKAKKEVQDNIKDVGGFVGGYVSNGRRKADNIVNRQLLTLDLDHNPSLDIWDDLDLLYGCAAALYSTHKHSSLAPRFRLTIPLDRPVFCDEYQAIARRVAGDLGINVFDDTTFEPSRLMYWPSTARDGEYVFRYADGPWIEADKVLARYADWRDSTSWPESDRSSGIVKREMKKQGDPFGKPGLIGAFCRTYSIQEAIDIFLSEVYESCGEGRYTYREGSTAAGLVLYEDKFAYSHHGTDPISGKLCNAFDLCRLHLFGLKDEDAKDGTAPNRLPSYLAMVELASQDKEVRKAIAREKIAVAGEDFGDEENTDWMENLDADKKGNLESTIDNILLILENDPRLKGRIAYNEFDQKPVIVKNLPWREYTPHDAWLREADVSGLRHYLEKTYGISRTLKMDDALNLVAEKQKIHPVRSYLKSLEWDGVQRVESLFINYLGAADTPYTREVTKKLLCGAVARVFDPGCKFDYIIVLIGPQGIGKSSIIRILGRGWFSDTLVDLKGKEAYQQLQGVWIMEMAELSSMKKAELEVVKHFVTKQSDEYRPPYGHYVVKKPRQCVFFGTTNTRDFLRDATGNRRFWPIDTMAETPVRRWQDLDDYEVDQIWAETVALYAAGENLYLDPNLEETAEEEQKAHSEMDDRAGTIEEYLTMLLPERWDDMSVYERRAYLAEDESVRAAGINQREKICVAEIWCELMGRPLSELNPYASRDFHNIMRQISGWEEIKTKQGRLRFGGDYGRQKAYVRCHSNLKK